MRSLLPWVSGIRHLMREAIERRLGKGKRRKRRSTSCRICNRESVKKETHYYLLSYTRYDTDEIPSDKIRRDYASDTNDEIRDSRDETTKENKGKDMNDWRAVRQKTQHERSPMGAGVS